jgi:tRNA(fMet)-specific endonuclease VapC
MSFQYLIDTNICSYIIKQKPLCVLRRFEQISVGTVGMSIITYGELIYGAEKSHHSKESLTILERLTTYIPPLPLPAEAARYYGKIRSYLEKQGKPIGNNDLWITAHALSLDLILVTNNEKEFKRVPHLKIENWVA